MHNRRSFLQRLGLGAGAALLGPIARRIVYADARAPIRFVFVTSHAGSWQGLTPPGVPYDDRVSAQGPLDSLPAMLAPLEAWRDRMVLFDGFTNEFGGNDHGGGYSTYSAVKFTRDSGKGGKVEVQSPAGVTIDQHLGSTLPVASRSSVTFGTASSANVFAEDADRPVVPFRHVDEMYSGLFGSSFGTGTSDAGLLRHRRLRDALREDTLRLLTSFRGDERVQLEDYLTALEDFDRRREAELGISCSAPPVPTADGSTESHLEACFDMGTVALGCGLTHVLGAQVFTGNTHNVTRFRYHRIHRGTEFDGEPFLDSYNHDFAGVNRPTAMRIMHTYHAALLATLIRRLEALPEGAGSVFDRTVIVHTVDGGAGKGHHVTGARFPVLMLAGRDVPLRTGFYQHFETSPRSSHRRSLVDLWLTLLEATGMPRGHFAMPEGGRELVQPEGGPLESLLV